MSLPIILLDIEGTISPLRFIKEVLFPYASRMLPGFIQRYHDDPPIRRLLAEAQAEAGIADPEDIDATITQLLTWIQQDRKSTSLKALQGLIWQKGYREQDFKAPVYADAYEQLAAWHAQGRAMYVYSSGSVYAQKLFFSHTEQGSLVDWFTSFFDTTTGAKQDIESYQNIVKTLQRTDAIQPRDVLFLSDIVAELEAAREAGLQTTLVVRPEDTTLNQQALGLQGHPWIYTFKELMIR